MSRSDSADRELVLQRIEAAGCRESGNRAREIGLCKGVRFSDEIFEFAATNTRTCTREAFKFELVLHAARRKTGLAVVRPACAEGLERNR